MQPPKSFSRTLQNLRYEKFKATTHEHCQFVVVIHGAAGRQLDQCLSSLRSAGYSSHLFPLTVRKLLSLGNSARDVVLLKCETIHGR